MAEAAEGVVEPSGEATVFIVFYGVSIADDPLTLRLILKPGALSKPFGKKIVEPFLKHVNTKLGEKEQVSIDDLEKVLIGPGDRLSDRVTDLSASVKSVTPEDVNGQARVDLIPRKARDVRLVCSGVQLDVTVPPDLVHVPLNRSIVPQFLTSLNKKFKLSLKPEDIASAKTTINLNNEMVDDTLDITQPAADVLPRAGRTQLDVVLTEAASTDVADKLPKPPKPGDLPIPQGQVFRVRCGEVELKVTLPAKGLSSSLRDGVVAPFMKLRGDVGHAAWQAYAKKRPGVSVDDVSRVLVDGMAVSDALLASSFASGAPVVRVDLTLGSSLAASATKGAKGADAAGGPAKTAQSRADDENCAAATGEATPVGEEAAAATAVPMPTRLAPGAAVPVVRKDPYYEKWAAFDDEAD